ncbi:hypothetical protein HK101_006006 [Irineochytrium annulatum]|nr:hypothetical protein HK101_006006 [Irineochytrium annulatum]
MAAGFEHLRDDIVKVFLPAFKNAFPGVGEKVVWRDCPPIGAFDAQRPAWSVPAYNGFVRKVAKAEGMRVLGWHDLVEGRGWRDDAVHQNKEGQMAFAQMLMCELELMEMTKLYEMGKDTVRQAAFADAAK